MKTWLLTIAENRRYLGNEGYSNNPCEHYSYDNHVPNSKAVSEGDIVIVREGDRLTGVSVIESIVAKPGMKKITRCPVCQASRLRYRKTIVPKWKCDKGHEFDQPKYSERPATRYTATFSSSYQPLSGEATWQKIRPHFHSASVQSIRRVHGTDLMTDTDPELYDLCQKLKSLTDDAVDAPRTDDKTVRARLALATLQSFLEGCRSEDDKTIQNSNKLPLPLPSDAFRQLEFEVASAKTALEAPVPSKGVLTRSTLYMRGIHNFWDGLTKKAGESIGAAAGTALVIGTAGIVGKLTGLLDAAIKALQALI